MKQDVTDVAAGSGAGLPSAAGTTVNLTDDEIALALQNAYEGFRVQSVDVDPDSSAVPGWMADTADSMVSADFAFILLYRDMADALRPTEQAYLNNLQSRFEVAFPFQNLTRIQCANVVVLVKDVALNRLRSEFPDGVTCRAV